MAFADYPNYCSGAAYWGTAPTYPSTIYRSDTIYPAGDYDWFYVYAYAGKNLRIYTTGSTDTYGYLTNNSCGTLATNDDSGSSYNFMITRYITTTGWYRIGVRHYSSSGTGSYGLYVYQFFS